MYRHVRTLFALMFALIVGLGTSGCVSTPGAVVGEPASSASVEPTSADSAVVEEGDDSDDADDAEDAEEGDSEGQTATLGSTVRLGDWEVTVVKVTKNANKLIKKANMFNSKPKGQYLLVDYTAKYVGSERKADAAWDLRWSFTDSEQNVLDQASEVTPADKADKTTEARKGGTIKHQVLFDIKPSLINGGILSAESDSSSEYADFKI